MAQRTVSNIADMPRNTNGAGFDTHDMGDAIGATDVDPFILTTLFEMSAPTFPPHPHAGFFVATYMLPESPIGLVNQDSVGTRNRIEPGAIHVTVAGGGAVHEEQPERPGAVAKGFQIWIDLPDAKREAAAYAVSLVASAVPAAERNGARIRVIAGESNGVASPLATPTPLRIVDVTLEAGASFTQDLGVDENAFLIVHRGTLLVEGKEASDGQMVRTRAGGDLLSVTGGYGEARCTLFAGHPLRQTRVMRGPMVARDDAQMNQFMRSYAEGRFGSVVPFSHAR